MRPPVDLRRGAPGRRGPPRRGSPGLAGARSTRRGRRRAGHPVHARRPRGASTRRRRSTATWIGPESSPILRGPDLLDARRELPTRGSVRAGPHGQGPRARPAAATSSAPCATPVDAASSTTIELAGGFQTPQVVIGLDPDLARGRRDTTPRLQARQVGEVARAAGRGWRMLDGDAGPGPRAEPDCPDESRLDRRHQVTAEPRHTAQRDARRPPSARAPRARAGEWTTPGGDAEGAQQPGDQHQADEQAGDGAEAGEAEVGPGAGGAVAGLDAEVDGRLDQVAPGADAGGDPDGEQQRGRTERAFFFGPTRLPCATRPFCPIVPPCGQTRRRRRRPRHALARAARPAALWR